MVCEMQIIKQELQFEKSLKQRIDFICEFSKLGQTFKRAIERNYIIKSPITF